MCNNKSVEDQISSEPKTISKIFVQHSKLSVILQEESHTIGLLSIQIEKYEKKKNLNEQNVAKKHFIGGWGLNSDCLTVLLCVWYCR